MKKTTKIRLAVSIVLIILSIWIFHWLDSRNAKQIAFDNQVANAFYKFMLGIGALITAIAGFEAIEGWINKEKSKDERIAKKERQRELDIKRWKELYPPENYLKTYRVIQSDEAPGVLYVQDLPKGPKHWIANPETLRDIDMDYSQAETVSRDKFRKIPSAGNINTRSYS